MVYRRIVKIFLAEDFNRRVEKNAKGCYGQRTQIHNENTIEEEG